MHDRQAEAVPAAMVRAVVRPDTTAPHAWPPGLALGPGMRAWSWRSAGLAVASGALLAFSAAPFDQPALAFGAPALLLLALDDERDGALSIRRGLAVGFLAGFVCNAVALSWIVGLLQAFGGFPLVAAVPVAMLLFCGQAVAFALAAAGAAALGGRGAPLWLVLPAAWTVAFSLTPALFPWRPAATQVSWLPWVQLADVGGQPLLDLLLALAGCGLVEGLRARRLGALMVAAACVLGPLAYGVVRIPEIEAERAAASPLSVGVVQPNVGIYDKHDPRLWHEQLVRLRTSTAALEDQGAELVVWPETAYPYPMTRGARREPRGRVAPHRDGVTGPLLIGSLTVESRCRRWNSAVALESDGTVAGIADKVELLAFGEYVPLWHVLPPLQDAFQCPGITPGERPQVLELAGSRIAVLNCYEDVLDGYARRVAVAEPDFLVNVTNDAWFGDTSEPWLHHMVARMRAIETRRDLLRAVNTGVSAHVSATGEDLYRSETWVADAFVADVRRLGGQTWWVRFGDPWTPSLEGALLGAACALRPRRRS